MLFRSYHLPSSLLPAGSWFRPTRGADLQSPRPCTCQVASCYAHTPCPFCPQPTGQTQGTKLKLLLKFLFPLETRQSWICGSPAVGSGHRKSRRVRAGEVVHGYMRADGESLRAEVGKWRGPQDPRASRSWRTWRPWFLTAFCFPLRCYYAFCTQGLRINPLT